jgi:hypothetical protein
MHPGHVSRRFLPVFTGSAQATTSSDEGNDMATATRAGEDVTGTKDKAYDIIWFVEKCLSNALRMDTFIEDAERDGDDELAEFFRKAQHESRKGAEQGKALMAKRLAG